MVDDEIYRLAEEVGEALKALGWMMVSAESCTGGWVGEAATAVPGSSRWYDRGFITYSNEAKQDMLGVSAATLEQHGAVSGATVAEMAAGALRRSRAQVALAISGIAGPQGGMPDKPVGTVWFAWALRDGRVGSERHQFSGDRQSVRRQAVAHALRGVLERINPGTAQGQA
ncbi:MAG: nicotinamide-nucleotide amidase [Sulfuricellaceae bacterium]|nr:nicotinamide-nucleotide amidase [Sulfuricellaceae bacterium]